MGLISHGVAFLQLALPRCPMAAAPPSDGLSFSHGFISLLVFFYGNHDWSNRDSCNSINEIIEQYVYIYIYYQLYIIIYDDPST